MTYKDLFRIYLWIAWTLTVVSSSWWLAIELGR